MPFQKGQSGNPGGKPGAARQDLNALLDQVFKPARRRKVLEKLIDDAEAGNHDARTLLMAYTWGRPVERKEISGPDGEPFKGYIHVSPDAWDDDTTEPTED